MNGLGYLSAEWRPGDRVRTWNELPIDRAIPAGTPFEIRVGLVDDGMRRLPIELEGVGARALDRVGTVRPAVDEARARGGRRARGGGVRIAGRGRRPVRRARRGARPADGSARRDGGARDRLVLPLAAGRPDGAKPSAPRDPGAVEASSSRPRTGGRSARTSSPAASWTAGRRRRRCGTRRSCAVATPWRCRPDGPSARPA
ncbi:MAG: hypothetical protein U0470_06190 [Anaerolineae bacterium]